MGLFDFNANEPLSYEALQMRRKIAEQLAARRAQPYPKNVGEGIFSAADSLVDAYQQKSLEARMAAYERQYQSEVDKHYGNPGRASTVAAPLVPPVPTVPGKRADYPYSSTADIWQTPMGETYSMADYNRNPKDDMYG